MNLSTFPKFCSNISTDWPFPLVDHAVAICSCNFDKNNFADTDYAQSLIALPSSLQTAINKRKAEYLAGRLCAREALAQLNCQGYPAPQMDKSPLWPAPFCGSISHSHQIAASIVAKQQDWQSLGLDIEELLTYPRSEKILSTITNMNEQQLIGDDLSLFTTLAFSIKESLFKALYPLTHKRFYFADAAIIAWSNKGEVTIELLTDLSKNWQRGQQIKGQFCIKEGYLWSFIAIANPL